MEIRIESLIEGARRAKGTVVVIDVFRAFTTAAVAFARGVEKIILTAEPDEALALRKRGLTRDEFAHILAAFPLVFPDDAAGKQKKAASLATYDRMR